MHKAKRFICLILCFFVLPCLKTSGSGNRIEVLDIFQTSSQFNLGIDAENVRLGWKLGGSGRNLKQSAYYIEIRDKNSITYNSGWVESSSQTGILATGLKTETIYFWKVKVKDHKGKESAFSKEESFETAPKILEGSWIGGDNIKLTRKEFKLSQSIDNIESARSYLGSASPIEIHINGGKVGDNILSPIKPVANVFVYYNTYDILPYLSEGSNTLGVMLSNIYPMGGRVLGMIKIKYKDGNEQIIRTDNTWFCTDSSFITKYNLFSGEDINGKLLSGWDANGYKMNSTWKSASEAGIHIKDGFLSIPSNSGTYYTKQTFNGDYTVKAGIKTNSLFGILFGKGSPYPFMWQITTNSIRKHMPGDWKDIRIKNVTGYNIRQKTDIRIEVKGTEVITYINNKIVDSQIIPDQSSDGPLGIRSAIGESFDIDYIHVIQNDKIIFEDDFDYIDIDKWTIPGEIVFMPAISSAVVIEEIKPVEIKKINDSYVIDFGKNISGYVRVNVKGNKDDVILVRYSELINDDGSIYPNTTYHYPECKYTLTGNEDIYEPKFFYTGFRYVEVKGIVPDEEMVTACYISDNLKQTGSFITSDKRLNDIFMLYYNAQRSNMTGNYTDCPQREKNGWTGDASVTKRASAIILNDYTSAEVFMRSMYLNIYEDGRPSVIVPHLSGDNSLYEEFDIPWASAYFTFPYYTYMQTGDKYYIEESYYSLLKVFDYFKSTDKNKDFLIEYNRYGDWLGYDNHDGKVNRQVISTMYFYHCGKLLSQMAEIIGREHNELDIYLEKVRSALNKIELKTQTEKAIALDFNIVPDADRENTKKSLLKLIRDADTTLRTGVLGTMSLYNSLSVENGHKTLIDLTLTDKKCSFGYMLDHGATTLWEYWDVAGSTFNSNLTEGKPAIWDSQNHCMLGGGLTNWLFGGIGGIEPISAAYRSIKLRPGVESGLKKVECSLDTVIGKVISDWRFVNNKFVYSVVVPVNAEASLILPFENAKSITESGRNIFMKSGDGIKYERKQKEGYVYTLGSGTYYFEVSNTKANNYKYVIASILCDIVVSALIVICYLINKHRKEKK